MIGIINRKLIENIAYADNTSYGENIEASIFNLVSLALADLETRVPYVRLESCILQPINETFNYSYIPGSDFIYFLGIPSPQLEINSLTYSNRWEKFKERLARAWAETSRKQRKKKARQKEAGVREEKKLENNFEKYTLYHLLEDLQEAFSKNLSQSTIIYKRQNSIKIVGKEDFGVNTNIIIYPVILEDDDYKFFISKKKGFVTYNFKHRAEVFNKKLEKIGPNYLFMLKTLNYLITEFTKHPANQLLVEGIMNGCPEEFLKGDDIYACFIKLINYLRFTDITGYESVLNDGKTIFNDISMENASMQYSRFLKSFDNIKLENIKNK